MPSTRASSVLDLLRVATDLLSEDGGGELQAILRREEGPRREVEALAGLLRDLLPLETSESLKVRQGGKGCTSP
jgi:hypothetical protein